MSESEIAEIEKRHTNHRPNNIPGDTETARRMIATLHQDRATLLRLLKSRQPHVTLTPREMAECLIANEFLKARPDHNPISDLMLAIRHLQNMTKTIDRLCLTKAESSQ